MQVIQEAAAGYFAALGQPNMAAESYRACAFCLSAQTEQGTLFYHLATKELILLEGDLETQQDPVRQELIRRWFLVPTDFHEYQWFDDVRGLLRLIHRPGNTHTYTIMTTMDCNARCFYCYEAGRRRTAMTMQMAENVAAYILKHSKGRKIKICWFGGEPLMNVPVIDRISEILMKAQENFESSIVSNGYLFTEELARRAKERWRVNKAQITLDGTEQVYNRAKAYVNSDGSAYRRVMDNIGKLLANGICVSVRLNLDSYNAEDLLALCDELAERFPDKENLRVYAELLFETQGFTPARETEKRYAELRRLEEKLRSVGLMNVKPLGKRVQLNHCKADDDDSVVITPSGALGKCEHFSETELFGSIDSQQRDEALLASWKERVSKTVDCESCRQYPICNRLKKCPDARPCDKFQRAKVESEICQSMLAAYEEWRKRV